MLMECVVVRIVYYPSGGGFFPRFLKLSNLYRWAVTIFLLNTSVFSSEGFPFLFSCFTGAPKKPVTLHCATIVYELTVTKSVYYQCKSQSPQESQARFSAQ